MSDALCWWDLDIPENEGVSEPWLNINLGLRYWNTCGLIFLLIWLSKCLAYENNGHALVQQLQFLSKEDCTFLIWHRVVPDTRFTFSLTKIHTEKIHLENRFQWILNISIQRLSLWVLNDFRHFYACLFFIINPFNLIIHVMDMRKSLQICF